MIEAESIFHKNMKLNIGAKNSVLVKKNSEILLNSMEHQRLKLENISNFSDSL